ncbi:MAG: MBL fold metallo-hydrolase [Terriglobales bacterium]
MAQAAAGAPGAPEAASVLERALQKFGGRDALRAIDSIYLEASGVEHRSAEVQGYEAEAETAGSHHEILVVSPGQPKLIFEYRIETARLPNPEFQPSSQGRYRWRRFVYDGPVRRVGDFVTGFAMEMDRGPRNHVERQRLARRVPFMLLLEALENAAAARLQGTVQHQGRLHYVIHLPLPDSKAAASLLVDAESFLLSAARYRADFPGLGDTDVEFTWSGYQPHPQLGVMPRQQAIRVGGRVYREMTFDAIRVNSSEVAELAKLPARYGGSTAAPGSVEQIRPGVFLVHNLSGYTLMFVEFADFVVALEAPALHPQADQFPADNQPGSASVSEEYIRKIKQTLPGKPIRYVVVSHYHSDHAGGARAFVAEGTTVITTPDNRGFFERLAAAPSAIVPDAQSRAQQPLRLEMVTGHRTITDGIRSLALYNVGANPHTAENLVAYLPAEKLLYQGDLFYFDGLTLETRRAPVMHFLARWIERQKLSVDWIYGFHQRDPARWEEAQLLFRAYEAIRGNGGK